MHHVGMTATAPPKTARTPLITVRAALRLPEMARGVPEIVAADRNADRPVRWVHAGEVRNMAALLKGGELLLTTGMGLTSGDSDQRRFVAELSDRGLAGLVIELGTTFDEVPRPIRAEAEDCGLPVIALHKEVPFVEITEALHRAIVNRQFVMMRRGDELHRRFTDLVLNGAGIPEVLEALAETIANPVVLEKTGEGVLYHATHHSPSGDALAAWGAVVEDVAMAPHTISVGVPTTGGETWGCLAALAIDSPLDEFDRVAVERAVGLIALALLRSRQEELLSVRERGNFLADVMESRVSETEAAARAASIGFERPTRLLLPMTVRRSARTAPAGRGHDEITWALMWRDVRRELHGLRIPVVAGTRPAERDMLVIVGLDDEARRAELADRAASIIHLAAGRHLGDAHAAVVAVGSSVTSWTALPPSCSEATDAAAAAAHGPPRDWHDAARPDLHRLLWSIRDASELQRFVERRLAPLIEHDRVRRSQLLPTLEAYCEHGGRKAETARSLHLERQSLYHRLDRIEALIGDDLSDETTMFGLDLALRARRYLEFRDSLQAT